MTKTGMTKRTGQKTAGPFSFLWRLIWYIEFLVNEFLVSFLVGRADCQRSEKGPVVEGPLIPIYITL
ncbi:hypothetical protein AXJ18_gp066 [Streptomyces phage Jay2Jay]|uniref:Uncharacterized protein n=1 Tax=Streptomyces phage Jay2Jay TaxID=1556290 RepID=A0A0A0RLH6_9CAUD|nr:hypothetical protein AXJ18_gp066 [Streptomyces phage Jay2Jay]AIW02708.1 hypothetical protein PBI_JAY2JAY_255 [Streptomyces phage Jay2Jay]